MNKEKISNIAYYLIIGLLSMLTMAVVPMIGSELGLGWQLPNTVAGWIVWSVSKGLVAIINMMIFHCFMEQAKVNIKDNPKYIEGKEILQRNKQKEVMPMSPTKWTTKQYVSKGTTLFLATAVSLIGLTQAILTFDILTFIALAFTLLMGAVFGYLNMKKAEQYWTGEFYEYAKLKENQSLEKEKEDGREKVEPTTTSGEE